MLLGNNDICENISTNRFSTLDRNENNLVIIANLYAFKCIVSCSN